MRATRAPIPKNKLPRREKQTTKWAFDRGESGCCCRNPILLPVSPFTTLLLPESQLSSHPLYTPTTFPAQKGNQITNNATALLGFFCKWSVASALKRAPSTKHETSHLLYPFYFFFQLKRERNETHTMTVQHQIPPLLFHRPELALRSVSKEKKRLCMPVSKFAWG